MPDPIRLELMGDLARLIFDVADSKVNTLGRAVWTCFERHLAELEPIAATLRAVIVESAKPGQFIAGADLREIEGLVYASPEDALPGIKRGQQILNRLSELPCPTIAVIAGPAFGGGLEVALACDARIAIDQPKTLLSMSEVKLGLIPAWGGTQRLPRLVGIQTATHMLCQAQIVSAQLALESGLVDALTTLESLEAAVESQIERLHENSAWQQQREKRIGPLAIDQETSDALSAWVKLSPEMQSMTRFNHAPHVAWQAMRDGCDKGLTEGLEVEQTQALKVFGSPTSANLISLFFADRQFKPDVTFGNFETGQLTPVAQQLLQDFDDVVGRKLAQHTPTELVKSLRAFGFNNLLCQRESLIAQLPSLRSLCMQWQQVESNLAANPTDESLGAQMIEELLNSFATWVEQHRCSPLQYDWMTCNLLGFPRERGGPCRWSDQQTSRTSTKPPAPTMQLYFPKPRALEPFAIE